MSKSEQYNLPPAEEDETVEVDPALSRQIDENLQLLYRSKLETALPSSLQALVDKLMKGEGQI